MSQDSRAKASVIECIKRYLIHLSDMPIREIVLITKLSGGVRRPLV
ncbi:hypothetical protein [Vibrio gazogenes]|nr:hypothetical protein [Vibrio gazogenes]USP13346.1 hypothetical protein MKS89_13140 [Vibrio gazogenes]